MATRLAPGVNGGPSTWGTAKPSWRGGLPASPPPPPTRPPPAGPPPPMYPTGQPPAPTIAPPKSYWQTPGSAEQWWKNNSQRLNQPTKLSSYWEGVQGKVMGPGPTPTNTQQAWDDSYPQMSTMGAGTRTSYNGSSELAAGPGAGERAAAAAGQYFSGASEGETGMRSLVNSGYFTAQGQGETGAYSNARQLASGPGAAENNLVNAQRSLGNINYGNDAINLVSSGVKGAQNAQNFNRGLGDFTNGNNVQDEYGHFAQGLRNKSYSEQAYESGAGGLIDPYQRAADKRTLQLNNELAARGMYNSGAALRAQGEMNSDIAASEAKDRIALAKQADDERLGRTGQAMDFANSINSAAMGRKSLGLQSATAADESQRGNIGLGLNARQFASGEALGKVDRETSAANNAQQAQIDRLFKGGQLGLQADDRGQARTQMGMNALNDMNSMGRNRNLDLVSTGKTGQELQEGRIQHASNIGLSADQEERSRIAGLFSNGQTLDTQNRDAHNDDVNHIIQGAGVNQTIDGQDLERFKTEHEGEGDVQDRSDNRRMQDLSEQLGLGSKMAGLTSELLSMATTEGSNFSVAAIQSKLLEAGYGKDEADKMAGELFQSIGNYAKTLHPGASAPGGNYGGPDGLATPGGF